MQFFPLSDYAGGNVREPEENAAAFATAEVENLLEKFKMEYRVREALYDGAQTGDYCAFGIQLRVTNVSEEWCETR